jgi:hypothetical protein
MSCKEDKQSQPASKNQDELSKTRPTVSAVLESRGLADLFSVSETFNEIEIWTDDEFKSSASSREQRLTLVGEVDARSERIGDRWVLLLEERIIQRRRRENNVQVPGQARRSVAIPSIIIDV